MVRAGRRPSPGERTLFGTEPPAAPASGKAEAVRPARLFAEVALQRPVRHAFTYAVPDALLERAEPGRRAVVLLGRRREVGVVVGVSAESAVPVDRVRPLLAILDDEPLLGPELLELARWMARRYAASWGEALAAVLPAALKRERAARRVLVASVREGVGKEQLSELEERFPKQHRLLRALLEMQGGVELRDLLRRLMLSESPARSLERRGWVRIRREEPRADPLTGTAPDRPRPEHLSGGQERAIEAAVAAVRAGKSAAFLLQGVTGSGKTEVYLQVIERALELGRGAIVLVPEIALTPQAVGWFRSRFGRVEVLHSRMTDLQRTEAWLRLRRGEARVVVGARSAIFAPVGQLGIVVVDEEHEPSFKQGSTPRYHARDVALERARRSGAVCILGSATPSLESWHGAREGRLELLRLPERVGGGSFSKVHVVDMRLESGRRKGPPVISRLLRTLLEEVLAEKEQAILFQNRRGYVPVLYCPGCTEKVRCRSCSTGLTLHRRIQKLVCHSCCEELPVPAACPSCTRPGLRFLGAGGERVEEEVARLCPDARVQRMDSDTMRRFEDYERALEGFGRGEIDVLVGTQMIAKGLDFPRVTLVGVVSADQSLYLPDFRSGERTFQLISQVAGRAGRSHLPGRIVVQTFSPDDPAIVRAARGDYEGFAALEARARADLNFPPFSRMVRLVAEDTDLGRAHAAALELARSLRTLGGPPELEVLPALPAPTSLLRGRYRFEVVLKHLAGESEFESLVDRIAALAPAGARPRITIDVEPVSLF